LLRPAYGCDDGRREIDRSGKFPLNSSLVWHRSQHIASDHVKVLRCHVKPVEKPINTQSLACTRSRSFIKSCV